ncbi:neurogenic locus notch -like protein [Brachionus plicatilis]|uniref:Neurogenic locus notch-like protein n=1 Tax=Brachionus plicatilis TaxID=10195 RepID=A0A3M7R647_BRAPC|nr:neurogenic locus notch -like protein [Brachionus plicatilis]
MDYLNEANWATCPPATAAITQSHNSWLRYLSAKFNTLETRICLLETENRNQSIQIATLQKENDSLKHTTANNTNESSTVMNPNQTFASMLQGNNQKSESEMVMLTKVSQEFKRREKIENNIIISGLPEHESDNQDEKNRHDVTEVGKILEALGVDKTKCKRVARIRVRAQTTNTNNDSVNATRPAMMLVELKDNESKRLIITQSRVLARDNNYKNVYINQDRTITERIFDKQLREDKKDRNSKLEHVETVNNITLRYKKDAQGKRWFWGIRNDELVWVLHQDDRL